METIETMRETWAYSTEAMVTREAWALGDGRFGWKVYILSATYYDERRGIVATAAEIADVTWKAACAVERKYARAA